MGLDNIRDDLARDEIKKLKRQMLRTSDKLSRLAFEFDLLQADRLPDPPPNPGTPKLGIKLGAPNELWMWGQGSDSTWSWDGPIHTMT